MQAPEDKGNYELRYYKDLSDNESDLLHKVSFTIGDAGQQGGNNITPSGNNSGDNNNGNSGNNGGNNNGGNGAIGYPAYWLDEIPKMNGTVEMDLEMTLTSFTVEVKVKKIDVVNSYADLMVGKGYERYADFDDGGYLSFGLKNGKYNITVEYFYDTNQVNLGVSTL